MILVITWLYIGSYTILLVTRFFFLSHLYRALVVDTTVDLFAFWQLILYAYVCNH
jgi:hypothetical protein